MKKLLPFLLAFLFATSPAFGAIAYTDGEIGTSSADPYVNAVPSNGATDKCVVAVVMDQRSGAVSLDVVANDPADDSIWIESEIVTVTNLIRVQLVYTNNIDTASASVWAYLTAGIDGSSINIQCYSGVAGFGITNTNSGSSTAPSISLNTQDADNFIVAFFGFAGNTSWTPNVGNGRNTYDGGAAGQAASAACDNTVASPGAVTCSYTLGSSKDWAGVAIELRSVLGGVIKRIQGIVVD